MPNNSGITILSRLPIPVKGVLFVLVTLVLSAALVACDQAGSDPGSPTAIAGKPTGEQIFSRYCNVCHPGGGMGSGPSLIMSRRPESDIRDLVRHGKGRMPGFGESSITEDELNILVDYVLALRK